METLTITVALWQMKQATEPFLIQFVKADGSISRKNCLYRGSGKVSDDDTPIKTGMPGKFTLKGLIPLYDVDEGHLVTPKIAHIVAFKKYQIRS